ncbi:MAG: CBS and ACT domain-containing protein [Candidatus Methylomirabilales bacterium]
MKVGRRMTRSVVTIEREASLRRARRIMDNKQIRHLPVVEKDRLVGLLTDRDIRAAAPSSAASIALEDREEFLDQLRVGHVMTKRVLSVAPEATIEDAALLMRQHKISCLPVVEGERLVGIITETDIFDVLMEVLGVEESSSRLEILCDLRSGFVTEVSRVMDDQGVRLVSLLTVSEGEGGAVVILRVATADPASLCEALRRAGFTVRLVQRPDPAAAKGEGTVAADPR